MQTLIDFLNFQTFISPFLLKAMYAMGALGIPVFSLLLSFWIRRKFDFVGDAIEAGKEVIKAVSKPQSRILLIVIFILFFISMEIMWRMMFEFMVAYFQMHHALVAMPTS